MTEPIKAPAVNPCGSCPYRRDVPSGLWAEEEYARLPQFDLGMPFQPPSVFMCHQADGRVCAGWAGCHDMEDSLGIRLALIGEYMSEEVFYALLDYVASVPLFASGAEAAAHGRAQIADPPLEARRTIRKLERRLERTDHTKGER